MKTMLSYIGIKGQDNSIPMNANNINNNNTDSYVPTSSAYNPPSSGMASGIHYMPPRDIQNRKAI
jgi:hypothetical protein